MTNLVSVDASEIVVTVTDSSVNVNVCENITEVVVGNTGPQGPRGTSILSGPTDPSPNTGLIGDQYVNTSTGTFFGPKTESGWGTGTTLGTGLSIENVAYAHYQTSASDTWTIVHPLLFTPNIIVISLVSGTQREVIGDYEYNGNTITATFSQPISGAAYLS